MRWKLWVIFGLIQCLGLALPFFANVHSNMGPFFLGILLLFPGSLIAIFLPETAGLIVTGILVVGVNSLLWYLIITLEPTEIMK